MNTAFAYSATGYIDYGMLGAAQIDNHGNVNSTMLGNDFNAPERRFPGSGGGNQVLSYCWKTIVVMKHEPRRFVERVDFITSPGYINGYNSREELGLPANTGPWKVVTSKALFGFDRESRKLKLEGILMGQSIEGVLAGIGFLQPLVDRNVKVLSPPNEKELELLRNDIDPSRTIISGDMLRVEA